MPEKQQKRQSQAHRNVDGDSVGMKDFGLAWCKKCTLRHVRQNIAAKICKVIDLIFNADASGVPCVAEHEPLQGVVSLYCSDFFPSQCRRRFFRVLRAYLCFADTDAVSGGTPAAEATV